MLIVQQQLLGVRRFSDLQARLGIGPTVLAGRLAALVEAEVVEKGAHGYRLTERGRELWSLLLCLWAWEQRWVQGAALPTMRHACGEVFRPSLSCASCSGPADWTSVAIDAADLAGAVPAGSLRRRTGGARPAGPGLFPETMSLMGSRWSSATLGAAFLGARRFGEFEAVLSAPANVVAERLRQFVERGVLDADYRLTPKGQDFFPAVALLVAWGERWYGDPARPSLVATHRECGRAFVPQLTCSACAAVLNRADVMIEDLR